jgi:hypothetical protein
VSTTSWTLPAHAALFTGLYDTTHGLVDNGLRFGKSVVTLAEVLKEAGYRTAGFYAGPYLKETYGFARGFETYVSCMSKFEGTLPPEQRKGPLKGEAVRSFRDVTGPTSVEKVTEWLGTLDDRPFFLFIHLWGMCPDGCGNWRGVLLTAVVGALMQEHTSTARRTAECGRGGWHRPLRGGCGVESEKVTAQEAPGSILSR